MPRARLALPLALALLALLTGAAPATAQKAPFGPPASPFGAGARPTPPTGPRSVPGEVIVRYRSGTTSDRRLSARRAGKVKLERGMRVERAELVRVSDGQSVPEAVAALKRDPDVELAQPNHLRYLNSYVPNDGDWGRMWGLHNGGAGVDGKTATADADIDAPEAWDFQRGSSSVSVAVIDTGIKRSHSDLDDNLGAGWDFIHGDDNPEDLDGHGTHVAGTIGAEGNNNFGTTGVAHDVTIHPFKVFGTENYTTDQKIADAFQLAGTWGLEVANASLGGEGAGPIYDAVVRDNPGVLYVVSAGNDGTNNELVPQYPCNVNRPNLICVAASDQNDGPASFSNYGATSVDIAAPGTEIWSTWPHVVEVYRDGFETAGFATRWTTGGTNNRWNDFGALNWTEDGQYSMQDGPGTYLANTNSWAQHSVANLVGLSDCGLGVNGTLQVEPGQDFLHIEASRGSGAWNSLASITTSAGDANSERSLHGSYDLSGYTGYPEFWLRFRLTSNATNHYDGAYVDDVAVKCANYTSGNHISGIGGTSMASPHVAGAAALLFAQKPSASVAEVRAALLENGDPLPASWGARPTVTGRRLNVYGALLEFIAPGTVIATTPGTAFDPGTGTPVSRQSSATFAYGTDQAQSSFECSLDDAVSFATCPSSGTTYTGLAHGEHTFRVRTRNRAGVRDATPASYTWLVDRQAPDIASISGGPSGDTTETSASFGFSSTEAGSSYKCRLTTNGVAGSWEPCSPPKQYDGLAPAAYELEVEATDVAGNPDPTPASRSWRVTGPPPPAERNPTLDGWSSGASLRGDFNGDGYDDVAIGVPGEDYGAITDAGGVHVLYGGATAVTGTGSLYFTQANAAIDDNAETGDAFGAALAVGDFNNDGRSDLAIGAPGENVGTTADAGVVHVLLGSASGLTFTGQKLWTQGTAGGADPVEAGDRFGAALATGETTGDGKAELLVGSPGEDVGAVSDAGAVHLLAGGVGGVATKLITQATAGVPEDPEAGDQFGASLALGDFNGDGKADLAIGAPNESVGTAASAGAVTLLAGATAGYTTAGTKVFHQDTLNVANAAETADHFGAALAAGNLGGTAADELAVGVPQEDGEVSDSGAVHALMGASGSLLTTNGGKFWDQDTAYVPDFAESGDAFGSSLAIGNFWGGAQRELAIGAPMEDVGTVADAGAVTVFPGASAGPTSIGSRLYHQGTTYMRYDGLQPGDHYGATLGASDSGDSAEDDLLVGVPDESVGNVQGAGVVQRIPGGGSGGLRPIDAQTLSQATANVADAPETGDGFGAALGR